MSWYYTYYLAKEKDGVLYPAGPFHKDGKLMPVLSVSRSFASDLHDYFRKRASNAYYSNELYESILTDECLNECKEAEKVKDENSFAFLDKEKSEVEKRIEESIIEKEKPKNYREALEDCIDFEYLPLDALPKGSFVKEGYVLSSQIDNDDVYQEFYPILTPHVYAEKLKTAALLGTGKNNNDDDDEEDVSNFVYHKWIDYSSKEWESYLIDRFADMLYMDDIVVVKTEG